MQIYEPLASVQVDGLSIDVLSALNDLIVPNQDVHAVISPIKSSMTPTRLFSVYEHVRHHSLLVVTSMVVGMALYGISSSTVNWMPCSSNNPVPYHEHILYPEVLLYHAYVRYLITRFARSD